MGVLTELVLKVEFKEDIPREVANFLQGLRDGRLTILNKEKYPFFKRKWKHAMFHSME